MRPERNRDRKKKKKKQKNLTNARKSSKGGSDSDSSVGSDTSDGHRSQGVDEVGSGADLDHGGYEDDYASIPGTQKTSLRAHLQRPVGVFVCYVSIGFVFSHSHHVCFRQITSLAICAPISTLDRRM